MALPLLAAAAAGAVIQGMLAKHAKAPNFDEMFREIDQAGTDQRQLINALPADLQKQYEAYKASNAAAGETLKTDTAALGDKLRAETSALYDPNAPAVRAAIDAMKTQTFADVPGQQAAIREALAATGGFDRGTASQQLAAPVIQAAGKVGQGIQNITAQQLQQKQQAELSAINTITSMDNNVIQQLFGMSKEQALTIMNSNRQDLKDQMSALVSQSVNQSNQKLGAMGANLTNQYMADVGKAAQTNALTGGLVNVGVQGVQGLLSGLGKSQGDTGYAPPSYASYNSGDTSYPAYGGR